jgi:superfamily I DNA and/or RNA helicase
MLLEQHRMRPVISGMVSRLWYESKLRDGESVLSASPLEETILEAYAKLKPFWNGSTRMMVAVQPSRGRLTVGPHRVPFEL